MDSALLQSSVPKCSQNRIFHWELYEHTAFNNHRQAKCRLLFWVRHSWMDLHLISCTAQSLWTDLDFDTAIFRADVRTAWRLASVKGVATHTVPRADSDTLSSQSTPWTLSVAYFSRQKSKQRVGDPFLTWKEATGTSFSCSSGFPAFSERDLPWSSTNCYPLHVAGMTTLEWASVWIQDLHSHLRGHRNFIYMIAALFPDRTILKISDTLKHNLIDWKNDLWTRSQRTRSVGQGNLNIWMYILLMMSLVTMPGKSPGKCPVESDWGLTSGGGIDFSGITWYRHTDYQKLLGNKDYLHFLCSPRTGSNLF